jgi:hypothetical protein
MPRNCSKSFCGKWLDIASISCWSLLALALQNSGSEKVRLRAVPRCTGERCAYEG